MGRVIFNAYFTIMAGSTENAIIVYRNGMFPVCGMNITQNCLNLTYVCMWQKLRRIKKNSYTSADMKKIYMKKIGRKIVFIPTRSNKLIISTLNRSMVLDMYF